MTTFCFYKNNALNPRVNFILINAEDDKKARSFLEEYLKGEKDVVDDYILKTSFDDSRQGIVAKLNIFPRLDFVVGIAE